MAPLFAIPPIRYSFNAARIIVDVLRSRVGVRLGHVAALRLVRLV